MEPLVLIVDDNEKNLKLARDVLQAAGFRTLEAETGAEGIALAAEHLPDVDPHGSPAPGHGRRGRGQGTRRRRADSPSPDRRAERLQLVGDDEWLLAAGFAGYVEKPIDVHAFPGRVRSYCRR